MQCKNYWNSLCPHRHIRSRNAHCRREENLGAPLSLSFVLYKTEGIGGGHTCGGLGARLNRSSMNSTQTNPNRHTALPLIGAGQGTVLSQRFK